MDTMAHLVPIRTDSIARQSFSFLLVGYKHLANEVYEVITFWKCIDYKGWVSGRAVAWMGLVRNTCVQCT